MNKPSKPAWEKTYGEILDDFVNGPYGAQVTYQEKLAIHRRWTSLGKKVAKGAR